MHRYDAQEDGGSLYDGTEATEIVITEIVIKKFISISVD